MPLKYCKSWFRAKKQMIGNLTEQEAEQAHEERSQYTVIVEEERKPTAFAEISNDYIGVGFLDYQMREILSYQFQEKEENRIFLTMAAHREFDGDRVIAGTTYYFDSSGRIAIEKTNLEKNEKETSQSTFNPDSNWERYPSFGHYIDILKRER